MVRELIVLAQTVSLWFLVAIAALGAGLTLLNRMRLRRVLLSWPEGRLMGYPLLPTAYLLATFGWTAWVLYAHRWEQLSLLVPLVLMGALWFFWALLASQRVITDYGIVQHVNTPHRSIPWEAIEDYFICQEARYTRYTFFYSLPGPEDRQRQRLELRVPNSLLSPFQRIVRIKVDRRFEYALERAYGREMLNE